MANFNPMVDFAFAQAVSRAVPTQQKRLQNRFFVEKLGLLEASYTVIRILPKFRHINETDSRPSQRDPGPDQCRWMRGEFYSARHLKLFSAVTVYA